MAELLNTKRAERELISGLDARHHMICSEIIAFVGSFSTSGVSVVLWHLSSRLPVRDTAGVRLQLPCTSGQAVLHKTNHACMLALNLTARSSVGVTG